MISQQESDSLNLIRWLSTLAIISCHILQGLGSDWAWVLNLGVQVFFFLSGFLYGNKRIVRARDFYLRRLLKLYVPYALWVAVAAALIGVLAPEAVTFTTVRRQLMMLGNLPGLNHLWFMYVIFLCYLLLPAIDRAISARPALALTAMALCTAAVLWLRYSPIYLWVALYYVGYLCGRFPRVQPYVLAISGVMTMWILATHGFGTDTFRRPELVSNIIHASAGTALFLALHMALRNVKFNNRLSHLLTNGGGYEAYLTHHVFILGPASLLFITPHTGLNILIIITLTIISSYALMAASSRTQNLCQRLLARKKQSSPQA